MLQLKQIHKKYAAGENTVHALQGISLQFRKNEFVSILGPSGCGKTTMLNIIGGLDQYTSGDLIIDGVSTKNYRDRDWDAYRNHSIGFVFQSYNLIPHQSVLQNVELALTLSGVSKRERRRRAKEVLEQVGLGDQLKKKPSEMSGGQMQRVAIARALVNNPDIILADEPTGALDTQTSVQVMEILKQVAKDRLVIMVTHNPELADRYSTRIIRMLDGVITDDSAPLSAEELAQAEKADAEVAANRKKRQKKPAMSWTTGFGLSLKNLFTKKGRTTLTAFAGSIGIIGIALIFAVSQGTTNYINAVQEDTLSSYPLTIEATTVDVGTLMQAFMGVASEETDAHEKDAVYSQSVLFKMINALNNIESTENDLSSFRAYIMQALESEDAEHALRDALSGVQYTYDLDLLIYTKNVDGKIIRSDTQQLLQKAIMENMGMDMSSMLGMQQEMMSTMGGGSMPMMGGGVNLWCQILPGKDGSPVSPLLHSQYDLVYGSWPNDYNEIVLVVDENNELDDMTLYAMGLESEEDMNAVFQSVKDGKDIETKRRKWTFQEICQMDFRVILNADCYSLDENTGLYTDLRETDAGLRYLYDNALNLKVTGIIRPNEDASSHMLSGSIAYTEMLTEHLIEKGQSSAALQAQRDTPDTDIFTGLHFLDSAQDLTEKEKETLFRAHLEELDEQGKAEAYVKILSIPSPEQLDAAVEQAMSRMTREEMEEALVEAMRQQMGMNPQEARDYAEAIDDGELEEIFRQMIEEQVKVQTAMQVQQQTAAMTQEQLAMALEMALPAYTQEQCAQYYEQVLEFSESSYEENLNAIGYVQLEEPATVNLYASSFENKDVIEEAINEYNENVEELKQIHYTDYVGIMMSSVTTIINAITYVLIAFVAISLVVSSIMIGVITLISVQERTKEIGILRAIGASKRNVSAMFNAETMIIGLTSGLLGVVVTWLLCIPINAIIQSLTGIYSLEASLPWQVAAVLVVISVLLTLVAGIIPSRSAAKKDPVVALRTE